MAKRREIDVTADTSAGPEAVFRLLADRSLVPGRRLGYVSISGLAINDYRASVDLDEIGDATSDGTTIRWTASFLPKIPGTGTILQRGIGRFLQQCADGLARKAGQSS